MTGSMRRIAAGGLTATVLTMATLTAQSADSRRLMMPGPGHALFTRMAGTWVGTMKVWNSLTPQAPPFESRETIDTRVTLDGRFLVEEARGSMFGMTTGRMSILGFDNVKQVYTLTF